VRARWKSRETIALASVTLLALFIYPIPFCIDCESPKPWNHETAAGEGPVAVWLFLAPLVAGFFRLHRGWIIPLFTVFALVITQPLGGVAMWSLVRNEGPFIVVLGVPTLMLCFGFGTGLRLALQRLRRV
jgi:hypothetical protein